MIPFLGSAVAGSFGVTQEISGVLLCEAVLHAARIPAAAEPLKPKRCVFTARTGNRVEVVSHAHDGLKVQRQQCGVTDEHYEQEWNRSADANLSLGAGKSGSLFLNSTTKRMCLKTISDVEMESFYDPFVPRLLIAIWKCNRPSVTRRAPRRALGTSSTFARNQSPFYFVSSQC